MARVPLYKITETEMIARIDRGVWEVGRRLPNEFELAHEFGVSQGTMRRALIALEGMGYLNRKPGRGTLVAARVPAADGGAAPPGPVPAPRLLGPDGADLVLEPFRARTGRRAATPLEADLFGTGHVVTLERTLKWRGDRAATDEIAVPGHVLGALAEDAPTGFDACLAEHGVTPFRIARSGHAELTDMAQSVSLAVDRHTALLCVVSVALDAGGAPLARQVLKLAVKGARLAGD